MAVAVMEGPVVSRPGVEAVLGRPERGVPIDEPLRLLAGERVLVTGAAGSLGAALRPVLERAGAAVAATDIDDTVQDIGRLDVRSLDACRAWCKTVRPTVVFHLAGAKHAPDGEADPWETCETNTVGTRNIVATGVRVVLASTCKAADPETAYGASKLIAERIVLNAGGTVARFYNVVETAGNVFETWSRLHEGEPLPVTPCERFFMSSAEAVALLLWAAVLPSGRYSFDPGHSRRMGDVARDLYPGRRLIDVPPRRGDRTSEPLLAECERIHPLHDGLQMVTSPHDPGPS